MSLPSIDVFSSSSLPRGGAGAKKGEDGEDDRAFFDLVKEMSTVHGGMTARNTPATIDTTLRKRVFRVVDPDNSGTSKVGITFPSTSSATAAVLKAKGRYCYVQYRPVPNPDKKAARKGQPWAHFSFSIDIQNKKSYIYRLVFSTEFERQGELQMGRVAHIPLPMPDDNRWTVLAIDLPAALAVVTGGSGAATDGAYSHVCGVQIRPSLLLRGVFTSDSVYHGESLPAPMAFPVVGGAIFETLYNFFWQPKQPEVASTLALAHKAALASPRGLAGTRVPPQMLASLSSTNGSSTVAGSASTALLYGGAPPAGTLRIGSATSPSVRSLSPASRGVAAKLLLQQQQTTVDVGVATANAMTILDQAGNQVSGAKALLTSSFSSSLRPKEVHGHLTETISKRLSSSLSSSSSAAAGAEDGSLDSSGGGGQQRAHHFVPGLEDAPLLEHLSEAIPSTIPPANGRPGARGAAPGPELLPLEYSVQTAQALSPLRPKRLAAEVVAEAVGKGLIDRLPPKMLTPDSDEEPEDDEHMQAAKALSGTSRPPRPMNFGSVSPPRNPWEAGGSATDLMLLNSTGRSTSRGRPGSSAMDDDSARRRNASGSRERSAAAALHNAETGGLSVIGHGQSQSQSALYSSAALANANAPLSPTSATREHFQHLNARSPLSQGHQAARHALHHGASDGVESRRHHVLDAANSGTSSSSASGSALTGATGAFPLGDLEGATNAAVRRFSLAHDNTAADAHAHDHRLVGAGPVATVGEAQSRQHHLPPPHRMPPAAGGSGSGSGSGSGGPSSRGSSAGPSGRSAGAKASAAAPAPNRGRVASKESSGIDSEKENNAAAANARGKSSSAGAAAGAGPARRGSGSKQLAAAHPPSLPSAGPGSRGASGVSFAGDRDNSKSVLSSGHQSKPGNNANAGGAAAAADAGTAVGGATSGPLVDVSLVRANIAASLVPSKQHADEIGGVLAHSPATLLAMAQKQQAAAGQDLALSAAPPSAQQALAALASSSSTTISASLNEAVGLSASAGTLRGSLMWSRDGNSLVYPSDSTVVSMQIPRIPNPNDASNGDNEDDNRSVGSRQINRGGAGGAGAAGSHAPSAGGAGGNAAGGANAAGQQDASGQQQGSGSGEGEEEAGDISMANGKQRVFVGHTAPVVALDISHDGLLLVSAENPSPQAIAQAYASPNPSSLPSATVIVWHYPTNTPLAVLKGEGTGVYGGIHSGSLSFSADGSMLAIHGKDAGKREVVIVLSLEGLRASVRCVALSRIAAATAGSNHPQQQQQQQQQQTLTRQAAASAISRVSAMHPASQELPIVARQLVLSASSSTVSFAAPTDIQRLRFSRFDAGTILVVGKETVRWMRVRRGHLPSRSAALGDYAKGVTFTDVACESHFNYDAGDNVNNSHMHANDPCYDANNGTGGLPGVVPPSPPDAELLAALRGPGIGVSSVAVAVLQQLRHSASLAAAALAAATGERSKLRGRAGGAAASAAAGGGASGIAVASRRTLAPTAASSSGALAAADASNNEDGGEQQGGADGEGSDDGGGTNSARATPPPPSLHPSIQQQQGPVPMMASSSPVASLPIDNLAEADDENDFGDDSAALAAAAKSAGFSTSSSTSHNSRAIPLIMEEDHGSSSSSGSDEDEDEAADTFNVDDEWGHSGSSSNVLKKKASSGRMAASSKNNNTSVARTSSAGANNALGARRGSSNSVNSMGASGAQKIFVATDMGTVLWLSYTTRVVKGIFRAHNGPIHCIVEAPGLGSFATCGGDGVVRLWTSEFTDFTIQARHEGTALAVAFSCDGTRVAVATGALPALGMYDQPPSSSPSDNSSSSSSATSNAAYKAGFATASSRFGNRPMPLGAQSAGGFMITNPAHAAAKGPLLSVDECLPLPLTVSLQTASSNSTAQAAAISRALTTGTAALSAGSVPTNPSLLLLEDGASGPGALGAASGVIGGGAAMLLDDMLGYGGPQGASVAGVAVSAVPSSNPTTAAANMENGAEGERVTISTASNPRFVGPVPACHTLAQAASATLAAYSGSSSSAAAAGGRQQSRATVVANLLRPITNASGQLQLNAAGPSSAASSSASGSADNLSCFASIGVIDVPTQEYETVTRGHGKNVSLVSFRPLPASLSVLLPGVTESPLLSGLAPQAVLQGTPLSAKQTASSFFGGNTNNAGAGSAGGGGGEEVKKAFSVVVGDVLASLRRTQTVADAEETREFATASSDGSVKVWMLMSGSGTDAASSSSSGAPSRWMQVAEFVQPGNLLAPPLSSSSSKGARSTSSSYQLIPSGPKCTSLAYVPPLHASILAAAVEASLKRAVEVAAAAGVPGVVTPAPSPAPGAASGRGGGNSNTGRDSGSFAFGIPDSSLELLTSAGHTILGGYTDGTIRLLHIPTAAVVAELSLLPRQQRMQQHQSLFTAPAEGATGLDSNSGAGSSSSGNESGSSSGGGASSSSSSASGTHPYGAGAAVTNLVFSADGQRIFASLADGTVLLLRLHFNFINVPFVTPPASADPLNAIMEGLGPNDIASMLPFRAQLSILQRVHLPSMPALWKMPANLTGGAAGSGGLTARGGPEGIIAKPKGLPSAGTAGTAASLGPLAAASLALSNAASQGASVALSNGWTFHVQMTLSRDGSMLALACSPIYPAAAAAGSSSSSSSAQSSSSSSDANKGKDKEGADKNADGTSKDEGSADASSSSSSAPSTAAAPAPSAKGAPSAPKGTKAQAAVAAKQAAALAAAAAEKEKLEKAKAAASAAAASYLSGPSYPTVMQTNVVILLSAHDLSGKTTGKEGSLTTIASSSASAFAAESGIGLPPGISSSASAIFNPKAPAASSSSAAPGGGLFSGRSGIGASSSSSSSYGGASGKKGALSGAPGTSLASLSAQAATALSLAQAYSSNLGLPAVAPLPLSVIKLPALGPEAREIVSAAALAASSSHGSTAAMAAVSSAASLAAAAAAQQQQFGHQGQGGGLGGGAKKGLPSMLTRNKGSGDAGPVATAMAAVYSALGLSPNALAALGGLTAGVAAPAGGVGTAGAAGSASSSSIALSTVASAGPCSALAGIGGGAITAVAFIGAPLQGQALQGMDALLAKEQSPFGIDGNDNGGAFDLNDGRGSVASDSHHSHSVFGGAGAVGSGGGGAANGATFVQQPHQLAVVGTDDWRITGFGIRAASVRLSPSMAAALLPYGIGVDIVTSPHTQSSHSSSIGGAEGGSVVALGIGAASGLGVVALGIGAGGIDAPPSSSSAASGAAGATTVAPRGVFSGGVGSLPTSSSSPSGPLLGGGMQGHFMAAFLFACVATSVPEPPVALFEINGAHSGPITRLIPLHGGTRIASVSAGDGQVRLWSTPQLLSQPQPIALQEAASVREALQASRRAAERAAREGGSGAGHAGAGGGGKNEAATALLAAAKAAAAEAIPLFSALNGPLPILTPASAFAADGSGAPSVAAVGQQHSALSGIVAVGAGFAPSGKAVLSSSSSSSSLVLSAEIDPRGDILLTTGCNSSLGAHAASGSLSSIAAATVSMAAGIGKRGLTTNLGGFLFPSPGLASSANATTAALCNNREPELGSDGASLASGQDLSAAAGVGGSLYSWSLPAPSANNITASVAQANAAAANLAAALGNHAPPPPSLGMPMLPPPSALSSLPLSQAQTRAALAVPIDSIIVVAAAAMAQGGAGGSGEDTLAAARRGDISGGGSSSAPGSAVKGSRPDDKESEDMLVSTFGGAGSLLTATAVAAAAATGGGSALDGFLGATGGPDKSGAGGTLTGRSTRRKTARFGSPGAVAGAASSAEKDKDKAAQSNNNKRDSIDGKNNVADNKSAASAKSGGEGEKEGKAAAGGDRKSLEGKSDPGAENKSRRDSAEGGPHSTGKGGAEEPDGMDESASGGESVGMGGFLDDDDESFVQEDESAERLNMQVPPPTLLAKLGEYIDESDMGYGSNCLLPAPGMPDVLTMQMEGGSGNLARRVAASTPMNGGSGAAALRADLENIGAEGGFAAERKKQAMLAAVASGAKLSDAFAIGSAAEKGTLGIVTTTATAARGRSPPSRNQSRSRSGGSSPGAGVGGGAMAEWRVAGTTAHDILSRAHSSFTGSKKHLLAGFNDRYRNSRGGDGELYLSPYENPKTKRVIIPVIPLTLIRRMHVEHAPPKLPMLPLLLPDPHQLLAQGLWGVNGPGSRSLSSPPAGGVDAAAARRNRRRSTVLGGLAGAGSSSNLLGGAASAASLTARASFALRAGSSSNLNNLAGDKSAQSPSNVPRLSLAPSPTTPGRGGGGGADANNPLMQTPTSRTGRSHSADGPRNAGGNNNAAAANAMALVPRSISGHFHQQQQAITTANNPAFAAAVQAYRAMASAFALQLLSASRRSFTWCPVDPRTLTSAAAVPQGPSASSFSSLALSVPSTSIAPAWMPSLAAAFSPGMGSLLSGGGGGIGGGNSKGVSGSALLSMLNVMPQRPLFAFIAGAVACVEDLVKRRQTELIPAFVSPRWLEAQERAAENPAAAAIVPIGSPGFGGGSAAAAAAATASTMVPPAVEAAMRLCGGGGTEIGTVMPGHFFVEAAAMHGTADGRLIAVALATGAIQVWMAVPAPVDPTITAPSSITTESGEVKRNAAGQTWKRVAILLPPWIPQGSDGYLPSVRKRRRDAIGAARQAAAAEAAANAAAANQRRGPRASMAGGGGGAGSVGGGSAANLRRMQSGNNLNAGAGGASERSSGVYGQGGAQGGGGMHGGDGSYAYVPSPAGRHKGHAVVDLSFSPDGAFLACIYAHHSASNSRANRAVGANLFSTGPASSSNNYYDGAGASAPPSGSAQSGEQPLPLPGSLVFTAGLWDLRAAMAIAALGGGDSGSLLADPKSAKALAALIGLDNSGLMGAVGASMAGMDVSAGITGTHSVMSPDGRKDDKDGEGGDGSSAPPVDNHSPACVYADAAARLGRVAASSLRPNRPACSPIAWSSPCAFVTSIGRQLVHVTVAPRPASEIDSNAAAVAAGGLAASMGPNPVAAGLLSPGSSFMVSPGGSGGAPGGLLGALLANGGAQPQAALGIGLGEQADKERLEAAETGYIASSDSEPEEEDPNKDGGDSATTAGGSPGPGSVKRTASGLLAPAPPPRPPPGGGGGGGGLTRGNSDPGLASPTGFGSPSAGHSTPSGGGGGGNSAPSNKIPWRRTWKLHLLSFSLENVVRTPITSLAVPASAVAASVAAAQQVMASAKAAADEARAAAIARAAAAAQDHIGVLGSGGRNRASMSPTAMGGSKGGGSGARGTMRSSTTGDLAQSGGAAGGSRLTQPRGSIVGLSGSPPAPHLARSVSASATIPDTAAATSGPIDLYSYGYIPALQATAASNAPVPLRIFVTAADGSMMLVTLEREKEAGDGPNGGKAPPRAAAAPAGSAAPKRPGAPGGGAGAPPLNLHGMGGSRKNLLAGPGGGGSGGGSSGRGHSDGGGDSGGAGQRKGPFNYIRPHKLNAANGMKESASTLAAKSSGGGGGSGREGSSTEFYLPSLIAAVQIFSSSGGTLALPPEGFGPAPGGESGSSSSGGKDGGGGGGGGHAATGLTSPTKTRPSMGGSGPSTSAAALLAAAMVPVPAANSYSQAVSASHVVPGRFITSASWVGSPGPLPPLQIPPVPQMPLLPGPGGGTGGAGGGHGGNHFSSALSVASSGSGSGSGSGVGHSSNLPAAQPGTPLPLSQGPMTVVPAGIAEEYIVTGSAAGDVCLWSLTDPTAIRLVSCQAAQHLQLTWEPILRAAQETAAANAQAEREAAERYQSPRERLNAMLGIVGNSGASVAGGGNVGSSSASVIGGGNTAREMGMSKGGGSTNRSNMHSPGSNGPSSARGTSRERGGGGGKIANKLADSGLTGADLLSMAEKEILAMKEANAAAVAHYNYIVGGAAVFGPQAAASAAASAAGAAIVSTSSIGGRDLARLSFRARHNTGGAAITHFAWDASGGHGVAADANGVLWYVRFPSIPPTTLAGPAALPSSQSLYSLAGNALGLPSNWMAEREKALAAAAAAASYSMSSYLAAEKAATSSSSDSSTAVTSGGGKKGGGLGLGSSSTEAGQVAGSSAALVLASPPAGVDSASNAPQVFLGLRSSVLRAAFKAPVRILAAHSSAVSALALCSLATGALAVSASTMNTSSQQSSIAAITTAATGSTTSANTAAAAAAAASLGTGDAASLASDPFIVPKVPLILFSAGDGDGTVRAWNATPRIPALNPLPLSLPPMPGPSSFSFGVNTLAHLTGGSSTGAGPGQSIATALNLTGERGSSSGTIVLSGSSGQQGGGGGAGAGGSNFGWAALAHIPGLRGQVSTSQMFIGGGGAGAGAGAGSVARHTMAGNRGRGGFNDAGSVAERGGGGIGGGGGNNNALKDKDNKEGSAPNNSNNDLSAKWNAVCDQLLLLQSASAYSPTAIAITCPPVPADHPGAPPSSAGTGGGGSSALMSGRSGSGRNSFTDGAGGPGVGGVFSGGAMPPLPPASTAPRPPPARVAVGFGNGAIRVFSLESMKEECRTKAHTQAVTEAAKAAMAATSGPLSYGNLRSPTSPNAVKKSSLGNLPVPRITAMTWATLVAGGSSYIKEGRKPPAGAGCYDMSVLVSGDALGRVFITPVHRRAMGSASSSSSSSSTTGGGSGGAAGNVSSAASTVSTGSGGGGGGGGGGGNTVAAGGYIPSFSLADLARRSQSPVDPEWAHDGKPITSVSVSSFDPSTFAVASASGSVTIWRLLAPLAQLESNSAPRLLLLAAVCATPALARRIAKARAEERASTAIMIRDSRALTFEAAVKAAHDTNDRLGVPSPPSFVSIAQATSPSASPGPSSRAGSPSPVPFNHHGEGFGATSRSSSLMQSSARRRAQEFGMGDAEGAMGVEKKPLSPLSLKRKQFRKEKAAMELRLKTREQAKQALAAALAQQEAAKAQGAAKPPAPPSQPPVAVVGVRTASGNLQFELTGPAALDFSRPPVAPPAVTSPRSSGADKSSRKQKKSRKDESDDENKSAEVEGDGDGDDRDSSSVSGAINNSSDEEGGEGKRRSGRKKGRKARRRAYSDGDDDEGGAEPLTTQERLAAATANILREKQLEAEREKRKAGGGGRGRFDSSVAAHGGDEEDDDFGGGRSGGEEDSDSSVHSSVGHGFTDDSDGGGVNNQSSDDDREEAAAPPPPRPRLNFAAGPNAAGNTNNNALGTNSSSARKGGAEAAAGFAGKMPGGGGGKPPRPPSSHHLTSGPISFDRSSEGIIAAAAAAAKAAVEAERTMSLKKRQSQQGFTGTDESDSDDDEDDEEDDDPLELTRKEILMSIAMNTGSSVGLTPAMFASSQTKPFKGSTAFGAGGNDGGDSPGGPNSGHTDGDTASGRMLPEAVAAQVLRTRHDVWVEASSMASKMSWFCENALAILEAPPSSAMEIMSPPMKNAGGGNANNNAGGPTSPVPFSLAGAGGNDAAAKQAAAISNANASAAAASSSSASAKTSSSASMRAAAANLSLGIGSVLVDFCPGASNLIAVAVPVVQMQKNVKVGGTAPFAPSSARDETAADLFDQQQQQQQAAAAAAAAAAAKPQPQAIVFIDVATSRVVRITPPLPGYATCMSVVPPSPELLEELEARTKGDDENEEASLSSGASHLKRGGAGGAYGGRGGGGTAGVAAVGGESVYGGGGGSVAGSYVRGLADFVLEADQTSATGMDADQRAAANVSTRLAIRRDIATYGALLVAACTVPPLSFGGSGAYLTSSAAFGGALPCSEIMLMGCGPSTLGQILAVSTPQALAVRSLSVRHVSALIRRPMPHLPTATEDPLTSTTMRRIRKTALIAESEKGGLGITAAAGRPDGSAIAASYSKVNVTAVAAASGAGMTLWAV